MKHHISLHQLGQQEYSKRANSGNDQVVMSWTNPPQDDTRILAGFCHWHGQNAPPKTLNYEEVIFIIEGDFNIELDTGEILSGKKGDVYHIPSGTQVRYSGNNAWIFFATTQPE